jgi:hypothetical protein
MSTTIVSDNNNIQKKLISLGSVTSSLSPLSFLHDNTYVQQTDTIKNIEIENQINDQILHHINDAKNIPINSSSFIMNWINQWFVSKSNLYNKINSARNNEELKKLITTLKANFIPDANRLRSYNFVSPYQDKLLIEKIKDVNDKSEYFRRSYNRLIENDKIQNESDKQLFKNIQNKDHSTLLNSSALFTNKKMRNLRKFYNNIGSELLLQQDSGLYNYYNNVNQVYKFVRFIGSTFVYQTAKYHILSTMIDYMGLSTFGMLGMAPVYIVISAYDIYSNILTDQGENIWDKLKYTVYKGSFVGVTDLFKEVARNKFGVGRIYLLLGSLVVEATMMIFDPKLNRKRSDELSKIYAESMDRDMITNLLLPTKQGLTVSRILSHVVKPIDWIAHLPESIISQLFSGKISSLPPFKIVNMAMRWTNRVYKFSIYTISSLVSVYACYNSISQCLPYLSNFFKMFENEKYGITNNISELWEQINNSIKDNIKNNIPMFGAMEHFVCMFLGLVKTMTSFMSLPSFVYDYAKEMMIYLYSQKQLVRFFINIPVSPLTGYITTIVKKYSQQYLSIVAPAFVVLYSQRDIVKSLDEYNDLMNKSFMYGGIGLASSYILNVIIGTLLSSKKEDRNLNFFTKCYRLLSNNFLMYTIDKVSDNMKQKFFGRVIEKIEVKYGRRDFLSNLNFSWLTNRIIIDEYFSTALNSSMVDVLSNIDTLNKISEN